jgi:molecular chaperone HtpG
MGEGKTHAAEYRVQVDLRSVVELLSRHLYSTPNVFLRELLQNAADAVHARSLIEPGHVGLVHISVSSGDAPVLVVEDNGIGLTEAGIHEFLATVGRSAKRDELGMSRSDYMGQFGIGLLSCFLVADEVTVVTRAVGSDQTYSWTGRADGTYDVAAIDVEREPGCTVFVRASFPERRRLRPENILALATRYASHIPQPITIQAGITETSIGGQPLPWNGLQTGTDLDEDTRAGLLAWGARELREEFLDVVVLAAPVSETTGLAFIAAERTNPGARQHHRVTLKGMLVAEAAEGLLPEWAFFARCVVDTRGLHPTASREALLDDDLLAETREQFAGQLRSWLLRSAKTRDARIETFVRTHYLALKAVAVHDDDLLDALVDRLPIETSLGEMTLGELCCLPTPVRYTPTLDVFRQLRQVTAAQGLCLVNGGYVYDTELLRRLSVVRPGTTVEAVAPEEILSDLGDVDLAEPPAAAALARVGTRALAEFGCDVTVRRFRPRSVPVLLTFDGNAGIRRLISRTRETAQGMWGDILGASSSAASAGGAQLCLNVDNDIVRALIARPEAPSTTAALQVLYVQALLLGHHPLNTSELQLLSSSVLALLNQPEGI